MSLRPGAPMHELSLATVLPVSRPSVQLPAVSIPLDEPPLDGEMQVEDADVLSIRSLRDPAPHAPTPPSLPEVPSSTGAIAFADPDVADDVPAADAKEDSVRLAPWVAGLDAEVAGLPPPWSRPPSSLRRFPLFSSLDATRLARLIERVRRVEVPAGEVVLRQGDPGDTLYVIAEGEVEVHVDVRDGTRPLGRIGEGEFFGELGILTDAPRMATVRASRDCQLLTIDRPTIAELLEGSPEVLRMLLRFFRDRMIERLVATSELFGAFSGEDGLALARRFELLEVEPGAALLSEGERASAMFVVLCGTCDVVRRDPTARGAELGPGAVFGERSILERTPSLATVRARGRVWALALPRSTFTEVIMTHPQVLEYLSRVSEERRARTDELRFI